jgi:hypothetical protein
MILIALACCVADILTTYIGMKLIGYSVESNGWVVKLAQRFGLPWACGLWLCLEGLIVYFSSLFGLEIAAAAVFGTAAAWNTFVILRFLWRKDRKS